MPTPTTPQHVAPEDRHDIAVERRTSPVLLVAFAVALVAFAGWWYAQQRGEHSPPQAILIEAPAGDAASSAAAPATPVARTRTPADAERAPAARIDRAPRPLAGNPVPRYPANALRAGAEAHVVLDIAVGSDGLPTEVRVVERSGARDRAFERAALQAARQWRFEPALRAGKPVAATVRLPIDFQRS